MGPIAVARTHRSTSTLGLVIVVVGLPVHRSSEAGPIADGLPARIALAAASSGGSVQLVGKAGDDPEGDAVVLALARGGVGHVAFLRAAGMATPRAPEPANPGLEAPDRDSEPATDPLPAPSQPPHGFDLDAADVDLALRYLTAFSVLVLGEPADPEMVRVANAAAGWADARLIVVVPFGTSAPDALSPDAIVFEAPERDPDGVFAAMVGSFAAALDDGDDPAVAFQASVEAGGWTPAPTE